MANTYDTSAFPLGSKDPRVLYNNAENEDLFMNDTVNEFFVDRPPFRRNRFTLHGMEQKYNRLLASFGFTYAGEYVAGLIITSHQQYVEVDGQPYILKSTVPVPYTVTGNWAMESVNFKLAGDELLRAQLLLPNGGTNVGVGASNVSIELNQTVSAESLGAFPDGSDVSAILQGALTAGKVVRLAPNKTYVATGLVGGVDSGLVCFGGWAKLLDTAGTNTFTLKIDKPKFYLDGLEFDGGNEGPYKFFSSQPGTRRGLVIGNPTGSGVQLKDVTVDRLRVHGYDYIGIDGLETVIDFSFGHRVVFNNVNVRNCYVGWWLKERFEYSTGTNCYGYECFVGMLMVGGNNTFVASNFEENFQNLQMTAGYNHAHGKFVGCSFNHAADGGTGFIGNGLVNGHTFTACTFWYSPITLSDCAGVSITQSQIVYGKITIAGGGLNNIDDNYTPQGLVKVFTGNTFTTFRRNRVSYDTTSFNAIYGDLSMRSVASSTLAYPISFSDTGGAGIPLTFELKKWNGEDASFLEQFGGAYLPKTAQYQVDMSVRFTTLGVGERPVLTLQLLNDQGTLHSEIVQSGEFSASQADCTISISRRMTIPANYFIRMALKTKTATGITIPTGGIYVNISSVD